MKSFCCRGHMGTFCRRRSQEIRQKVPNSTNAIIGFIVSSVDSPGQWCSRHKRHAVYQTGKDDVGLKLETGAVFVTSMAFVVEAVGSSLTATRPDLRPGSLRRLLIHQLDIYMFLTREPPRCSLYVVSEFVTCFV